MNIVPVKLHAYGYPGGTPAPAPFAKKFAETMSAKVAMPLKNINIRYMRKPFNYYGALASLSLTYLLNDIALEISSGRAFIKCCDLISGKKILSDYTIIQFADNVLLNSGVDGASVRLNRKILFTDGNPDALLHEFGHAIGLWTSKEQYDKYPKFGLKDIGFTAFVPEHIQLPGFIGGKVNGQRRIRHFPSSNVYWYTNENYFDVMGAKPKNSMGDFWPILDTSVKFCNGFINVLNSSIAKTKINAPPEPNYRRIYVTGKTARTGSGSYIYNYLLPWSFDIMDITDYSTQIEEGPTFSSFSDFQYLFEAFDYTGRCVYSETFYSGSENAVLGDYYSEWVKGNWYRTFDIPDSAVRYIITDKQGNHPISPTYNQPIWESAAGGEIHSDIISPTEGEKINADFSFEWSSNPAVKENYGAPVQPLRYSVWASFDSGQTWEPQSYIITDNKVDLDYDSISAGTNVILKVISSDGFSSHGETFSDFSIAKHKPSVKINSPIQGDRGTTSTVWNLSANVFHPDGDTNTSISWYSSIDGNIGNTIQTSSFLSVGTHDIICNAINSAGKASAETVNVHVSTAVDYKLVSNNLYLCSGNIGPYAGQCTTVITNLPLTVVFNSRAPGGASYIRARISMTSPDNSTIVLATPEWTNITDQMTLYHAVTLTPIQYGSYSFTAELISMIPEDSSPGDTSCSIACSTIFPPKIGGVKAGIIDFSYQDDDSIPTGLVAKVFNYGGQNLHIGSIFIDGLNASAFSIENDFLSFAVLKPGETGTVRIVFDPGFTGRNRAFLALPCNDPSKSAFALSLRGDYLLPEPYGLIFAFSFLLLIFKFKKINF